MLLNPINGLFIVSSFRAQFRALYETRETPSKMYSSQVMVLSCVIVESFSAKTPNATISVLFRLSFSSSSPTAALCNRCMLDPVLEDTTVYCSDKELSAIRLPFGSTYASYIADFVLSLEMDHSRSQLDGHEYFV
ncbi:hypothetical protein K437DRAFT_271147 [Tilletiaria anomala UBC 951]|uniref:Uncharacterized protein n=1 Tax=Tilletiaria anomala (strain ATCC 24038 / CBS 436.72 / UBC 951) TaxID=1037660 RepID=A0A066VC85_TILAU|nr:uncharacterized protein K437DRAFT_271147 [Tilletiaria anomala UBC 951]KDN36354.1 hypothetical protein K437DRAFT_271147 [Tilletiaria anomala UBC 951]